MPRPRTPRLSPRKIAEAALGLVDEAGDFTLPELARRLAVSPSSIYHHVQGRPAIINGMRALIGEQALAAAGFPPSPGSWQEQTRAWARGYRAALSQHAKAIPLLVGETVTDPTTLEVYERLAALFTAQGFTSSQVILAVSMLDNVVLGSAVDSAGPPVAWRTTPEAHPAMHAALLDSVVTDRSDEAFEAGVRSVLDYLLRQVPAA